MWVTAASLPIKDSCLLEKNSKTPNHSPGPASRQLPVHKLLVPWPQWAGTPNRADCCNSPSQSPRGEGHWHWCKILWYSSVRLCSLVPVKNSRQKALYSRRKGHKGRLMVQTCWWFISVKAVSHMAALSRLCLRGRPLWRLGKPVRLADAVWFMLQIAAWGWGVDCVTLWNLAGKSSFQKL